jgi:hypothetical protein
VHETAVAPASNNEAASPSDSDALKQRLAELQEAEQRHREQQAQIVSAMKIEPKPQQQKQPEFNESDRRFLGARPGLANDWRLSAAVSTLEGLGIRWGSPRFYESLEAMFPLQDFVPADKLPGNLKETKETSENTDTYATEPQQQSQRTGPVYSAPAHRDVPSFSGERPPTSPSAVRLSADERQIAAGLGLTELEFAKQKLELARRKAAGLIQDGQ